MFFAPYVPTFTSGWVPPPIPSMESEPQGLVAAIRDQADHVQRAEEAWKAGGANVSDLLLEYQILRLARRFIWKLIINLSLSRLKNLLSLCARSLCCSAH